MVRTYHRARLVCPPESEYLIEVREGLDQQARDVFDLLCPLLDGTHSIESVWGKLLVAGAEPAAISQTLDLVEREGLIEESPDSEAALLSEAERERYAPQMKLFARAAGSGDAGALSGWEYEGGPQQVALKMSTVLVAGGGITAAGLVRALALAGVGNLVVIDTENAPAELGGPGDQRLSTLLEHARQQNPFVNLVGLERPDDLPSALAEEALNLLVYCPDDFDESYCEELNELSLRYSVPFLMCRGSGVEVELGPLVIPGDTACYVCYRLRRRAALLPSEQEVLSEPSEAGRLNFALGADWLAVDVIKYLTHVAEPVLYGRMLRLSFASAIPGLHPVLKVPRCPSCGVHKKAPARKLWEE